MKTYYFIGIKGSGMSALANTIYDLGEIVLGSDTKKYYFTEEMLIEKGIEILCFNKKNIEKDYIVIVGNAFGKDHEEVKEAYRLKCKIYYYHDFISEYFKGIKIAVSGTHGKTTTTKILSQLIADSSYIIGDGTGKGKKDYKYFIYEACEYKNHFLAYNQKYGIITNIELDHPDFFTNENILIDSFQKFANNSETVIACGDDPNVRKLKKSNIIYYGFNPNNDVYAEILKKDEKGYYIKINIFNKIFYEELNVYGEHMILNYLAVYTLCYLEDIKVNNNFVLPKRRFTEKLIKSQIIIDDYAHHPTELGVLLNSVRQKYPNKDVILIFQPHTYTRTRSYFDEFVNVFKKFDLVFVDKIFSSAREKSGGITSNDLVLKLPNAESFSENILKRIKQYEDTIIIFAGAGDVNKYIYKYQKL